MYPTITQQNTLINQFNINYYKIHIDAQIDVVKLNG